MAVAPAIKVTLETEEVHSDEDVRIRSDTGWYKRVLDTLNVQVTTCVPYTHTSNPLCERQKWCG